MADKRRKVMGAGLYATLRKSLLERAMLARKFGLDPHLFRRELARLRVARYWKE
jgi:hypothetical protein